MTFLKMYGKQLQMILKRRNLEPSINGKGAEAFQRGKVSVPFLFFEQKKVRIDL